MLGRCGTAVDNILYPWCDGQGMRQQWNFTSDLGQMSLQVLDQSLKKEREFFIEILLVRIHLIIEIISVDRPCSMGV